MATTEETVEFRASDLIGSAGVGANGEKLVNTLDYHYPPELQAALLRRENVALTSELDDDAYASVARLAGVDKIDNVKVRGGERNADEAWVTYAYIDDRGDVVKGAFPYGDLGRKSSDQHISQRESILQSPAARDHLAAQAKADAAPDTSDTAAAAVDPFAALHDAKASDLVKLMEEDPSRVEGIKAFELATRGDKARSTVMQFEPEEPTGDGEDSGDGQGDHEDG